MGSEGGVGGEVTGGEEDEEGGEAAEGEEGGKAHLSLQRTGGAAFAAPAGRAAAVGCTSHASRYQSGS